MSVRPRVLHPECTGLHPSPCGRLRCLHGHAMLLWRKMPGDNRIAHDLPATQTPIQHFATERRPCSGIDSGATHRCAKRAHLCIMGIPNCSACSGRATPLRTILTGSPSFGQVEGLRRLKHVRIRTRVVLQIPGLLATNNSEDSSESRR